LEGPPILPYKIVEGRRGKEGAEGGGRRTSPLKSQFPIVSSRLTGMYLGHIYDVFIL
jgi:hypothetical protein